MDESYNDFELEYTSDDEIEDMLDALILSVGEQIEKDESRTSIINPKTLNSFSIAYKALCYLAKESGATVNYKLHEPYNSVGSISIIGNDITFSNSKLFAKVVALSSNIDVYPKIDGTIQMDLTFHGLTLPIE